MTYRIVTPADWKNVPLPDRHVTLALDFRLDATEAESVRYGLIPLAMEDKWFIYCIGDTLYLHRSWTGFCIAQVHFVPDGEGLRAVSVDLNREPEQYTCTDDKADLEMIERMIRRLRDAQLYVVERKTEEQAWLARRPPKPES